MPSELIRRIILAESGGDAVAISAKSAKGLMQITPLAETDALSRLTIPKGDLYDPEYNILVGTTYLEHLHERFHGDVHLVVAAYHMGPTKVQSLLDQHPGLTGTELVDEFAKSATRAYVRKILTP